LQGNLFSLLNAVLEKRAVHINMIAICFMALFTPI
jgi:hypothetical protein